jgi:fatty-acyl-CoA synthase
MADVIRFHAQATPEKLAILDLHTKESYTYQQADRRISELATMLRDRLQGRRGERVAVISRNSALMVLLQFACARAGAIFVPLNWRLAPPEIAALIVDAKPAAVVWQAEFDALAEPALAAAPADCRFRLTDSGECLGVGHLVQARPIHQPTDEMVAMTLLYTSGTSGKSKGVIITGRTAFYSALNYGLSAGVSKDSVFLCDMPLFHVAGLLAVAGTPLFYGGTLVVSQKFDPVVTFKNLIDPALGVTHYFCVTQMAALMRANNPPGAMKKLAHLKAMQTGGAPNPPASVRAWVEDGVPMIDGFGMTEIGSALSMPPHDLSVIGEKAGSVGLPSLFMEAKIVTADGKDAAAGVVGELWVRGPNVTPGYWNKPEETTAAFYEGWLKTGDSARTDEDGFFYIVDRTKDMFISGGENVYPVEVEAVIAEIPEVLDCAVIGVPDERWGEVGAAILLLKEAGRSLTEKAVIDYIRTRLAAYKAPKHVRFVTDLPRTPSGKVQKHKLKAAWMESDG